MQYSRAGRNAETTSTITSQSTHNFNVGVLVVSADAFPLASAIRNSTQSSKAQVLMHRPICSQPL